MSTGRKTSNYARKHAYLSRHALWGFEVPEPKPWKRRAEMGEGAIVSANRPCRYAADVAAKIAAELRRRELR